MDWERAWLAPAKINLFLHVIGRRSDGYHTLQTAFRFLDLADTLHFTSRIDGEVVRLTDIPGVPATSDLTVRAARMLQAHCGITDGASIALEKRLPLGGGLGGGSSDAATTLIALNHLWGCGLDTVTLQQLGVRLGADVPVFIHGRACFAGGIGEMFSDIRIPPAWYLLACPQVCVPTREIFCAPELRRDSAPMEPSAWHPGVGRNDLEPVATVRYPAVAQTLATLRQFGTARMTGSGACCFAEFASREEAMAAQLRLPEGTVSHVAKGLDQHPLSAESAIAKLSS